MTQADAGEADKPTAESGSPSFPFGLAVDTARNGVLEPNETSVVTPRWRNGGATPLALTGLFSSFDGPEGGTYTINDANGNYGTIAPGANQACIDCYAVTVTAEAERPAQHWDGLVVETVSTTTFALWRLHVGASFTDVPLSSPFYRFLETLLHNGVTGGCDNDLYCPANITTREQMSAFVLLAKDGTNLPVACAPPNIFTDVPDTSAFCRFIEELSRRGVVTGCAPNLFCPTSPVTREQMAIFVLRTLDPTFTPPPCTGTPIFNDVPNSSPFCPWIAELVRRNVVTGCGGGNYCPAQGVTREQMSVFITVPFGLALYGL